MRYLLDEYTKGAVSTNRNKTLYIEEAINELIEEVFKLIPETHRGSAKKAGQTLGFKPIKFTHQTFEDLMKDKNYPVNALCSAYEACLLIKKVGISDYINWSLNPNNISPVFVAKALYYKNKIVEYLESLDAMSYECADDISEEFVKLDQSQCAYQHARHSSYTLTKSSTDDLDLRVGNSPAVKIKARPSYLSYIVDDKYTLPLANLLIVMLRDAIKQPELKNEIKLIQPVINLIAKRLNYYGYHVKSEQAKAQQAQAQQENEKYIFSIILIMQHELLNEFEKMEQEFWRLLKGVQDHDDETLNKLVVQKEHIEKIKNLIEDKLKEQLRQKNNIENLREAVKSMIQEVRVYSQSKEINPALREKIYCIFVDVCQKLGLATDKMLNQAGAIENKIKLRNALMRFSTFSYMDLECRSAKLKSRIDCYSARFNKSLR